MTTAVQPRSLSIPEPLLVDRSKRIRIVGWLIFSYIVLLMFEGSLRKWIVPRYSDQLLVVRDPVLILIYLAAFWAGVFPRNAWITSLAIIGALSVILTIFVFMPYLPALWKPLTLIILYGFRTDFLHMPLIFLMAKIFDERDVRRIGWWILVGMIPLCLLMVAQFNAAPDSFINRAAGSLEEGGEQITAGSGKIRPPGTFSFISGPIFYCSLSAAFFLYGILSRQTYRMWLLIASGVSLVVAVSVSGSRGCVVSVVVVILTLVLMFAIRPRAVNQVGRTLLIGFAAAYIIGHLPVFKEGLGVLGERFTASSEAGDTTLVKGLVDRIVEGFTEPFTHIDKIPLSGYGLGLGTNAGSHFLLGMAAFLLSENEWDRVLNESGPILGMAFILWRTLLTCYLGYLGLTALKRGQTLPLLLFSCAAVPLITGQLGQPTSLGFAVVLAGLCLSSLQKSGDGIDQPDFAVPITPAKPLPRRSAYASRIHGPPNDSPQ